MKFTQFDLHRHLLQACSNNGFENATPIQEQAIPKIIAGDDVMACAQTGTGKTAAFTLPVLHRLMHDTNNTQRGPKVVILSPTRELAQQILESIRMFTKGTQIKTGMVVGGVGYGPQIKMLAKPLDILVATPGRLIDHMHENRVDLTKVQSFVLDEADRMLDMGFVKPVETICETMPHDRQTLLFSATFSPGVERLAQRFLQNPTVIKLAQSHTENKNITQSLFYTNSREQKIDLLRTLLEDGKVWQTVVFIKTKHQADKMAKMIQDWGHRSAALHGDMRQTKRRRVIELMHENKVKVLVATDVAARGLDIKDLSHVINFDLPQVAEDYVHRIGRTGRAGADGIAYSMVSRPEMKLLHAIEKFIGRKIEPAENPGPSSPMPKGQPMKKTAKGAKTAVQKMAAEQMANGSSTKGASKDGEKQGSKLTVAKASKPKRDDWSKKSDYKSDKPAGKKFGSKDGSKSFGKSSDKSFDKPRGKSFGKSFDKGGKGSFGSSEGSQQTSQKTYNNQGKKRLDSALNELLEDPSSVTKYRAKPKHNAGGKKPRSAGAGSKAGKPWASKSADGTSKSNSGEKKFGEKKFGEKKFGKSRPPKSGKKMADKFAKSKGFKGKKAFGGKASGKPSGQFSGKPKGSRPSA